MITSVQPFSPAKTYNVSKNNTKNNITKTRTNAASSLSFGCAGSPSVRGCVNHMIKPVDLAYRKALILLGTAEKVTAEELKSSLAYFLNGTQSQYTKKSLNQKFLDQTIELSAIFDHYSNGEYVYKINQKCPLSEVSKEFANSAEGIFSGNAAYDRVRQVEKFKNGNSIETFVSNDFPEKRITLTLPDRKISMKIDGMTDMPGVIVPIYNYRKFNLLAYSRFDDNLVKSKVSPAFLEMLEQCRKGEQVKPVSLEELKRTTKDPNITYLMID